MPPDRTTSASKTPPGLLRTLQNAKHHIASMPATVARMRQTSYTFRQTLHQPYTRPAASRKTKKTHKPKLVSL